jgi:glucokinase
LTAIARATGMIVDGGSDLMVKAAGARALNAALHAAIEGGVPELGTRLVVTWSTGVNSIYEVLEQDGAYRYFKAESGHISWQAQTPMEERYMRYLRRLYKTQTISVEWAASGSHGFRNACKFLLRDLRDLRDPRNWLRSALHPGTSLRIELENALRDGIDVGPLIDRAAATGDGFALCVIELVASIFGDYLRTLALVELPSDGIVLTGGVAAGPHFQRLYAELVYERLIGRGAEFHDDLATTDLRFADRAANSELGPRGAAILASQLQA